MRDLHVNRLNIEGVINISGMEVDPAYTERVPFRQSYP